MEYFTNYQIQTKELPSVKELEFQALQKKYLYVLLIGRLIFLLILFAVGLIFIYTAPFVVDSRIIFFLLGLFAIYFLWSMISINKGFKHKAYALRQKDVAYKSGWLWRHLTTAPFNRVQHVRIDQGPIERRFNLAKLKIFTAGGSSSDLTIPGLTPDNAHALKEFIVKQTLEDEEE